MTNLVDIFAGTVAADASWAPSEDELASLCERGEQSHPGLDHKRGDFVQCLAVRGEAPDDPGELYLASACASGSASALRVFADRYLDAAIEAVRHMHLPAELADDVKQKTSEKLLLAKDGELPKVVRYAGRGKLRGLIKVVATRMALSELRKHGREVAYPEAGPDIFEAPSESDAELAFVKDRYRAEFKLAFERAVDALTQRERNLLRLHLLRGVTLAALADIYSVHRATVTRWLAAAREKLLKTTRSRLGEQLELGRGEIESVMNWIGSRLDASVSRVLRTRAEEA
jgi:RNA polymerase sigma-70 factor (ECF subfamily)